MITLQSRASIYTYDSASSQFISNQSDAFPTQLRESPVCIFQELTVLEDKKKKLPWEEVRRRVIVHRKRREAARQRKARETNKKLN